MPRTAVRKSFDRYIHRLQVRAARYIPLRGRAAQAKELQHLNGDLRRRLAKVQTQCDQAQNALKWERERASKLAREVDRLLDRPLPKTPTDLAELTDLAVQLFQGKSVSDQLTYSLLILLYAIGEAIRNHHSNDEIEEWLYLYLSDVVARTDHAVAGLLIAALRAVSSACQRSDSEGGVTSGLLWSACEIIRCSQEKLAVKN